VMLKDFLIRSNDVIPLNLSVMRHWLQNGIIDP